MSTYNRVVAADVNASLAPTVRARLAAEMADPASDVGASLSDTFAARRDKPVVWVIGDSISSADSSYSTAFSRLGPLLAGDRLYWHDVAAAGGYTLAQIESDSLTVALAADPKPTAIVVAGGTNDMGAGSITTAVASLTSIIATIKAAGVAPILWTPPPRGSGTGGTYSADTAKYAAYVRDLANSSGYALLDAHKILADSSGYLDPYNVAPTPNTAGDNTHPNYAGHLLLARGLASIIRTLYPNELSTGLMSPLGPEATATMGLFLIDTDGNGRADGVGSYGSPVASVVAGAPVGNWQRESWTASVAKSGALRITTTGLTVGNTYEIAYLVESSSDLTSLLGPSLSWRSSSAEIASVASRGSTRVRAFETEDRLYIRHREVCPTGADRIQFDLVQGTATPTADGYVQIAQYALRDLTALGVA